MSFKESDISCLSGKNALITGATGGLGFQMARMLSGAGAHVILTGRNPAKGAEALTRLREINSASSIVFEPVDLGSLVSIADIGMRLCTGGAPIDILINNAGVMTPPARGTTSDGFELQFGTNHLGHFALTGHLLRLLRAARASRVVSVSSGVAAMGRIDFDNLQSERRYRPVVAYSQSKLANLLFARELQRRSDLAGWDILSVAAHPGHARTDLVANGRGELRGFKLLMIKFLQAIASQDAADGAMPAMLAATAPDVEKLDYYGPSRMMQQKGPPKRVKLPRRAEDDDVARRLWTVSERLTGVTYSADKHLG